VQTGLDMMNCSHVHPKAPADSQLSVPHGGGEEKECRRKLKTNMLKRNAAVDLLSAGLRQSCRNWNHWAP